MLNGESKIYKHSKAYTLYFSIPSKMVCDSRFTFKAGDYVRLEFKPKLGELWITKEESVNA